MIKRRPRPESRKLQTLRRNLSSRKCRDTYPGPYEFTGISFHSGLQEMANFCNRDFMHERVVRENKAIEEAIAAGVFPVRVGSFIVKDKDTLIISRPMPEYMKKWKDEANSK